MVLSFTLIIRLIIKITINFRPDVTLNIFPLLKSMTNPSIAKQPTANE